MKRALVFGLLAPVSVLFGVFFAIIIIDPRSRLSGLVPLVAMIVAVLSLPASVIAGAIDGYLTSVLPIALRATVMAIVGAIVGTLVSVGYACAIDRSFPPPLMPLSMVSMFVIGGAFCVGVCSLLSHDYGRNRVAVKD